MISFFFFFFLFGDDGDDFIFRPVVAVVVFLSIALTGPPTLFPSSFPGSVTFFSGGCPDTATGLAIAGGVVSPR